MKVRFCPKCQNADLIMVTGGEVGKWRCKNCGFEGSVFPEKQIKNKKW